MAKMERQITHTPKGHVLTNANVWSRDGAWIVYDTRSDAAGSRFDGSTIEAVNVRSGETRVLYRSTNGAHCGVATFCPLDDQVVTILGPENPTADWQYSASHRQGIVVDFVCADRAIPLDARDLSPPFTAGALRGGSHVHMFSADGTRVSFTYDDHVLEQLADSAVAQHDRNQRNVGVSLVGQRTAVPKSHPRNHDGSSFTVVVTSTVNDPRPGSDDISRAFEEAWVGKHGYVRAGGARQRWALAFQGNVVTKNGDTISEAFIVDLPDDLTVAGDAPLQGTPTTRPAPPRGTAQRRLTFTADRKFAGLQGPRHWLRSSPDGSRIAMLMRDNNGIVQIWTVSPRGGELLQVTRLPFNVSSAFSWSHNGERISCVADGSVFVTNVERGESIRFTERSGAAELGPRPEACVFSPNGQQVAYVKPVPTGDAKWNQVFVIDVD
jgi:hypothetical protein